MRRPLTVLAVLALSATPLAAQDLTQDIQRLFSFGNCGQPLCLTLTGNLAIHGNHFTGAAVQANANLLGFLTDAIGATLGSIPISATSSGATFRFVNGAPVSTATSAGPIFAERSQTLGRRALLVGFNTTRVGFDHVRGTSLDDISFNFSHQDVLQPGLGDVASEFDYINVRPKLDLTLQSTAVFATYGVSDRVDLGIAIPVVYASLDGSSTASILSETGTLSNSHHFGTDANPSNTATASASGSHTGIGDIAVRAKANLTQTARYGFSILGDARLPTGDQNNFTGTGHLAIRALGILSGRFGDFSPHVNGGYAFRSGELQNDAVLLTGGFDQLLAPWVTVAVDAISELQVGENKFTLPQSITYGGTAPKQLSASNIPERRDNLVNLSAGGKFVLSGVTLVANGVWPLGNGGMQAKSGIFTLGLEHTFR
jgi:hypothetical protein